MKYFHSNFKGFLHDHRNLMIACLLVVILGIGAFMRFYQLGGSGDGNLYYAATVKSMLFSWHNFFFAAFEPGGSLSVDKPPLGFWVQAFSAYFLGLNGFALALPNATAGVLSVLMIYIIVRQSFGDFPGLLAAATLAVMPVAISTERNNTIDGLLGFVLLLAAWAYLQSVHTGKLRWLFLGSFLVGVGFNIKMLQAFLPLPAFYAVYFFGSRQKFWKKIFDLSRASMILVAVSFSWAVVVDLVPGTARPYVDSTEHNTVMELIFGHNGIERILSLRQAIGLDSGIIRPVPPNPLPYGQQGGQPPVLPEGQTLPQGYPPGGELPTNQDGGYFPGGPMGIAGQEGNKSGSMDFGTPGALRLFTNPLAGEASWLLLFALEGLIILGYVLWKLPFDNKHIALILWAVWLIPEGIYFSYSQGLIHAYYLIMMGAPIAGLVAMTAWALWEVIQKQKKIGLTLALLLAGGTILFQAFVLRGTSSAAPWVVAAAGVFLIAGMAFGVAGIFQAGFDKSALSLFLIAMLAAPALWSALTTLNPSPNTTLPYAGPAIKNSPDMPRSQPGGDGVSQNQALVEYLIANTKPGSYLLATDRAQDSAAYILDTGRPVLTFGGFLGDYEEVTVDQVAALVEKGQLRFILSSAAQQYQDISKWVTQHCTAINVKGSTATPGPATGIPSFFQQTTSLYDCGG
jgi:4-amino-4-deoxy-L-arabinose transferase-like glycosyltransferase